MSTSYLCIHSLILFVSMQEVLTLTIEFIVTDCKDEHKNISRDVSVKLHSFALRLI